MTGGLFGLLVFAFLAAAALFSLWLHPRLPEHYRSAETTSNLRLGMGVIATITAVVLGLLISSVKGSFDLASRDVQALAADLIVLDRTLHFLIRAPRARGSSRLLVDAADFSPTVVIIVGFSGVSVRRASWCRSARAGRGRRLRWSGPDRERMRCRRGLGG